MGLFKKYKINPYIFTAFLIIAISISYFGVKFNINQYQEYQKLETKKTQEEKMYDNLMKQEKRLENMKKDYKQKQQDVQEQINNYTLEGDLKGKDLGLYLQKYSNEFEVEIIKFERRDEDKKEQTIEDINEKKEEPTLKLTTQSSFKGLIDLILGLETLNENLEIKMVEVKRIENNKTEANLNIYY